MYWSFENSHKTCRFLCVLVIFKQLHNSSFTHSTFLPGWLEPLGSTHQWSNLFHHYPLADVPFWSHIWQLKSVHAGWWVGVLLLSPTNCQHITIHSHVPMHMLCFKTCRFLCVLVIFKQLHNSSFTHSTFLPGWLEPLGSTHQWSNLFHRTDHAGSILAVLWVEAGGGQVENRGGRSAHPWQPS